MRVGAKHLAWIALIATPAMIAWTQVNPPLRLQPTSKLWVNGTSTVRAYECIAKTFDAAVAAQVPDAINAVLAGEKGVGAVELKVPADSLDCRNGTMNGHMLKAIKAKEHAQIIFTLDSYELANASANAAATPANTLTLNGTLSLSGVKKPITIAAEAKAGPDGTLVVSGKYALNMTEWGIKPPSLMLGTMKVREMVDVSFELLLKP